MSHSNTAILVCTCDRYEPLARFLGQQLDRCWEDHPPVFVCGTTRSCLAHTLPTSCDPRDWVGITQEACSSLLANGFTHVYLLLEDLPPLGRCNQEYLNRRLPELATHVGASVVSLVGWDQHREAEGTLLGEGSLGWMRNSPTSRWKYALHPAYWSIDALHSMCEAVHAGPDSVYSARRFESDAHRWEEGDATRMNSSYRIQGDPFSSGHGLLESTRTRKPVLTVVNCVRRLSRSYARSLFEERYYRITNFINGPYPTYWSGLMHYGKVHAAAVSHIRRFCGGSLLKEVRSVLGTMQPTGGNPTLAG